MYGDQDTQEIASLRASRAVGRNLILGCRYALALAAFGLTIIYAHDGRGAVDPQRILLFGAVAAALLGFGPSLTAAVLHPLIRREVRREVDQMLTHIDRRFDGLTVAHANALALTRAEGVQEGALRAGLGRAVGLDGAAGRAYLHSVNGSD